MTSKISATATTNMQASCNIEIEKSKAKPVFNLTDTTMRRILAQQKPADILALYAFLMYTAYRQQTQAVKAFECFIARGLKWSEAKVRRVKRTLRDMGLIETIIRRDRRTGQITGHYLRVRFLMNSPSAQNTTGGEMSGEMLKEENINADNKKAEESPDGATRNNFKNIPALMKPDTRSREEKLAEIKPPRDFPSQRDFDDFVESASLFIVAEYRPDLYLTLCLNKWHIWNARLNKWEKILKWEKFVSALNDKIAENIDCEIPTP